MGNLLYAASCRSRRSRVHRLWTGAAYPVVGRIAAETMPAMATSRTRLPRPCGAPSWSQRRRSPVTTRRAAGTQPVGYRSLILTGSLAGALSAQEDASAFCSPTAVENQL